MSTLLKRSRSAKKVKSTHKCTLPVIDEESTDINSEGTVASHQNAEGHGLILVVSDDDSAENTLFDD